MIYPSCHLRCYRRWYGAMAHICQFPCSNQFFHERARATEARDVAFAVPPEGLEWTLYRISSTRHWLWCSTGKQTAFKGCATFNTHTHRQKQAHKNTIPMKYWTFAEWSWWQVAAIGDLVQSPYLKPLYDSRFFSYFCFVVVVVGGRVFSICCL